MDQTRIKKRKESMILNALNNIVKYEIKNPELKRICFTYVDISRDKKTINVFVDYHDLNKIDSFVKKMNKNSGVFKGLLANKLKIWKMPNIVFAKDETITNAEKINKIINKMYNKKNG